MKRCIFQLTAIMLNCLMISVLSVRAQTSTLRYRDYSVSHQILSVSETEYQITFQYKPEGDIVKRTLESVALIVYENPYLEPENLPMTRVGNDWEIKWDFALHEEVMITYGFELVFKSDTGEITKTENNQGEWWQLLWEETDNQPVKGALQSLALLYAGAGDILEEDLPGAIETIENEIDLYPENLEARTIRIQLLLKESENDPATADEIEKEIDSFAKSATYNRDEMNYAINAYRLIGKDEKAEELEKKLIRIFPDGEEAIKKTLDDIMEIESEEEKTTELKRFCREHPDSPYTEYALSTLASLLIAAKDTEEMIRVGDELLKKGDTPAAAGGLAGLAGAFTENRTELIRAIAYARKAVELIQDVELSEKPSGVTDADWKDQLQITEARYLDVLGWAYVRNGDLENGLAALTRAAGNASMPGIYYHFAVAAEKAGRLKDAAEHYARAVSFDGETAEKALEALNTLWQKTGRDSTTLNHLLEEQEQWVINRYNTNVLSRRMSRPAPDFNLEDVKGGWVSLSDQSENVILLCFWGTWSQSSYRMLRDLQNLAYDYGQEALFLTVAVDPDPDKVLEYVKKYNLALTTLINDGTDRDYNLEGVPMLFVIDRSGRIQFKHRGYRPDLTEMLILELETLLDE